ncbi:MAG: hypothetical protein JWM10_3170 [Myxococcaceae bacterium]|nr:hypothetical protein [Myxococcaceae bacterium]
MAKAATIRKSAPSTSSAASRSPTEVASEVSGELGQLADIRARFAALSPAQAATFRALHDDEACRAKGTNTRGKDTFRIGMSWARTFGAHADDQAVNPVAVRWFLDCLSALGTALTGRAPAANVSHGAATTDAEQAADKVLKRVERWARDAAGSRAEHVTALTTALSPDATATNLRLARLRRLADHLDAGLASPRAAALGLFQLDAATVGSLRAAATQLDDLARGTPAPQQVDRDSPAVNAAEG